MARIKRLNKNLASKGEFDMNFEVEIISDFKEYGLIATSN